MNGCIGFLRLILLKAMKDLPKEKNQDILEFLNVSAKRRYFDFGKT